MSTRDRGPEYSKRYIQECLLRVGIKLPSTSLSELEKKGVVDKPAIEIRRGIPWRSYTKEEAEDTIERLVKFYVDDGRNRFSVLQLGYLMVSVGNKIIRDNSKKTKNENPVREEV